MHLRGVNFSYFCKQLDRTELLLYRGLPCIYGKFENAELLKIYAKNPWNVQTVVFSIVFIKKNSFPPEFYFEKLISSYYFIFKDGKPIFKFSMIKDQNAKSLRAVRKQEVRGISAKYLKFEPKRIGQLNGAAWDE